jgi:DNA-binding transcriptional ArsR family regulator
MADHTVPDYDLPDLVHLEDPEHFKALFDETRLSILDMLLERAATTTQLAEALERPKGTVGHHVKVLEDAGLISVVRTEKVRAIEAKYYGRTARTFDYSKAMEHGIDANFALARAAREISESRDRFDEDQVVGLQGVRYARIPKERAEEWRDRLWDLAKEFIETPRGGDVVYGLAIALYPTNRPHLS